MTKIKVTYFAGGVSIHDLWKYEMLGWLSYKKMEVVSKVIFHEKHPFLLRSVIVVILR